MFDYALATTDWEAVSAGQQAGPLMLLFSETRIFFATFEDLLRCKNGDAAVGSCTEESRSGSTTTVTWNLATNGAH